MSAPDADRNSRSVSTESAALRVWTRVLVRVCGNVRYQATVGRRYDEALSWLNKGLDFAHALESTSALFFTQTNQGLAHLLIEDLNDATHAFCDALTACRDSVEDVSVRPETVGSSWKRK